MFSFNKVYFFLAILLFIIEVLIALYVKDDFIRPYVGDILVVILLYCIVKSFTKIAVLPVAIAVLLFSFIVEFLQYYKIVEILNLENIKLARIIIGTSFSWLDILTYIIGFIIIIVTEKYIFNKQLIKSRIAQ